jgi:hypothetical protein
MSDMIKFIEAKLALFNDMPEIPKDKEATVTMKSGGKFKYKYSDHGTILKYIKPVLMKHGFGLFHSTEVEPDKQLFVTNLVHKSGGADVSKIVIPQGLSPQDLGAYFTYLRRYETCLLLGIVTEEDVDAQGIGKPKPEGATQNASAPKQAPTQTNINPGDFVITFGKKYKGKKIKEIKSGDLVNYTNYMESEIQKSGKKPGQTMIEFFENAYAYLEKGLQTSGSQPPEETDPPFEDVPWN